MFEHFLGYFELMDWFVGVSRVLMMYFWVYIASKLGFNFFAKRNVAMTFYHHCWNLDLQATRCLPWQATLKNNNNKKSQGVLAWAVIFFLFSFFY